MVTFFEEKDLVSFGEYLLSDERTKIILENKELESEGKDALKSVYHADLYNWMESKQNKQE